MYYASCRSACVPFNRLDPRYNAKLGNVPLERARLTLSCSRVIFTCSLPVRSFVAYSLILLSKCFFFFSLMLI